MHTPSVLKLAIGFVVLAAVFGALERLFPALPGVSIWRRDRWPDFVYWFFTPLVTRAASGSAVALALVLFGLALGSSGRPPELIAQLRSGSVLARQPPALQLIEALLVADFFGYWMHRAFHCARLWRFHAVHHSARMLDWLAATRLHPVNDAASKLAVSLPLILLGFGTLWLPRGRQPEVFGVPGNEVPEGFLGQLVYPWT